MMTTCPDCGSLINKRGLAAHRAGDVCVTIARARELAESGYERCTNLCAVLRATGTIVTASTGYHAGYKGTRHRVTSQKWAPAYLVEAARAGASKADVLRLAAMSPEERAAALTSLALGGAKAFSERIAAS